ncbi:hypothetical protein JCM21900_006361 [Sporobolomyces salmonicolor]
MTTSPLPSRPLPHFTAPPLRPRAAPLPPSSQPLSTSPWPARQTSLRGERRETERVALEGRRRYREAAAEDRRLNGLPPGGGGGVLRERRAEGAAAAWKGKEAHRDQYAAGADEGQFVDAYVGEVGTWEDQQEEGRHRQSDDSRANSAQGASVSRMNSTRRYMAELDPDDELEALGEQDEGDRSTWHSGRASEARDSFASLGGHAQGGGSTLPVKRRVPRESTLSSLTVESTNSDPFHYSVYEFLPSPSDGAFPPDLSKPLPPPLSNRPAQSRPTVDLPPASSELSPTSLHPVVRVGPPSPTTETSLEHPHDSSAWTSPRSLAYHSSPEPNSAVAPHSHATSLPPSPQASQIPSKTVSKNFSRPFQYPRSPPSLSSPPFRQEPVSAPSTSFSSPYGLRASSLRSNSGDSVPPSPYPSPNPLERQSSLGAGSSSLGHSSSIGHASSLGHSGSSMGGHSLSSSWDDRQQHAWQQHEEARRAIALARNKSQQGREERDLGNAVEELREPPSTMLRQGEMSGWSAYEGEAVDDAEPARSLHFPQLAPVTPVEDPASTSISPTSSSALPYSARFPARSETDNDPDAQYAILSSPISHQIGPPSPFSGPRAPPAPPSSPPSPMRYPLPLPASPPSFLARRPSDSPSTYSLGVGTSLSTSSGAASLEILKGSDSTGHRNVLRKARPSQRGGDASAPMARSPSAVSSQSSSAASEYQGGGAWSRFRSRSKSRSRGVSTPSSPRPLEHYPVSPPPPSQDGPYSPRPFAASSSTATPTITLSTSTSLSTLSPTLPLPSPSPVPLSPAEFARLAASRPAFPRSKTSASADSGTVAWVLKSVAGARTVQAGLVHGGESGEIYGGEGEEVEQLEEQLGGLRVAGGGSRAAMDQGPGSGGGHERAASNGHTSLYSEYSFYSLPDSPAPSHAVKFAPSPTGAEGGVSRQSTLQKAKQDFAARGKGRNVMRTPSGKEVRGEPVSPDDFLQLGIDHHEAGDLPRAAWCFEQSAKRDGGCAAGMLMYGLTLRHGWGCQVNASLGFRYLQSCAESIVEDLDRVVFGARTLTQAEANTKAAKEHGRAQSELVLALHELGVSYRFGWGVEKNKKMAVSYFILSADLGDADAQQDVAFCYANGKGCKKDMKKAAHYYRLAVQQGAEDWGLSWIYKPKYMGT